MKKNLISFAFGGALTASVFIFSAFNSKKESISNLSKPIGISETLKKAGNFTNYSKINQLIEGNQNRSVGLNEHYIKSETFNKEIVGIILSQDGVEGLRIYYGFDEETKEKKMIVVGVDNAGNDISKEVVLYNGITCPKQCPPWQ